MDQDRGHGSPPTRASWVLAALSCLLGALVVLWSPLLGDSSTLSYDELHPRYPAPWAHPDGGPWPTINPITTDGDFFVLPGLMRLQQFRAEGRKPWWDSAQVLGFPLAANQVFPIFLPWARATIGLDPISSLDWLLLFHMALAAFLAYRAARMLGGSAVAGAFAAVGFTLSTWMITRWSLPQITYTTACWPGLVVAVEWLRRGRWAAAVAEGGAWIGLSILAGFPQVGLIATAGFGLLVVLDHRTRNRRALASAGAAVVVGLCIAAPVLNSVASVFPQSARASGTSRALTASAALSPGALAGALLPELFGRPSALASDDPELQPLQGAIPRRHLLTEDTQENAVENALYPGIAVLLLAGCLLGRGVGTWARTLGAVSALAVLGALCIPWLATKIPPLEVLAGANPKRIVVLAAGCLPLAAALALDAVGRRSVRAPVWAGAVLLVLLAGAWAVGLQLDEAGAPAFRHVFLTQLGRQAALIIVGLALLIAYARGVRVAAWLLVGLLLADLLSLAWTFNTFPPQRTPFGERPALEWLSQRPGRVAVLGPRRLLPPSGAALHGIRSLHGNVPMLSRRTAELLACIDPALVDWRDPRTVEPLGDEASLDHPLLDLLEVRTIVHADPSLAERRGIPNDYESFSEGLAAFDRPGAGPRAFLCGGASLEPEPAERLRRLARADFPVHETVLVEQPLSIALPERGARAPVDVVTDLDGRIRVELDAPFAGILVVVESWHPAWAASVDGARVEPIPVDHALIGIPLTRGQHVVDLEFQMPNENEALWLSALGILAVLVLAAVTRYPSRRMTCTSGHGSPEV